MSDLIDKTVMFRLQQLNQNLSAINEHIHRQHINKHMYILRTRTSKIRNKIGFIKMRLSESCDNFQAQGSQWVEQPLPKRVWRLRVRHWGHRLLGSDHSPHSHLHAIWGKDLQFKDLQFKDILFQSMMNAKSSQLKFRPFQEHCPPAWSSHILDHIFPNVKVTSNKNVYNF